MSWKQAGGGISGMLDVVKQIVRRTEQVNDLPRNFCYPWTPCLPSNPLLRGDPRTPRLASVS